MRILIVTPAPPGSRQGNRITARRWARLLRDLEHRVEIAVEYTGQPADLLVALHARKSARAIARWHREELSERGGRHPPSRGHSHVKPQGPGASPPFRTATETPARPIILALTGTDLYRDLRTSAAARRSLDRATRLVVLQPDAIGHLPAGVRPNTRVILQSAQPPRRVPRPLRSVFEVCVTGHLRTVKDPFRAALAARLLPAASRVRITHVGAALTPAMRRRAIAEMRRNPRYRWLGEVSHARAQAVLARSRLLVISSRLEGGANVLSEALAAGVPVVSSQISGSIGLLGDDYAGLFPVGGTRELADLLWQCETDAAFYEMLKRRCTELAPLVEPARERQAWRELLAEL